MKKTIIRIAAAVIVVTQLFLMSSCEFVESVMQFINDNSTDTPQTGNVTEQTPETAGQTTGRAENGIPFITTPDVKRYVMPEETFADELEKEASEIIDDAIAKGIAAVLAMKDDRHSYTSYPHDPDPNGLIEKLTDTEREIYYKIVGYARNFESFSISAKEYGDVLKDAWFNILGPLEYYETDIASYLNIWAESVIKVVNDDYETYFTSLDSRYYDPYKDANTYVGHSDITMAEIEHSAKLMDRIADRIVRYMPEGLTAYDKYYYLAAVLTVHITYDQTPKDCFTAFGALVEGRCVCEGYSEAYFLLCKKADLWCAYRSGLSSGEGHQWNMVKLDSGIYNVDVTWCDVLRPFEENFYDNFMKTDAEFEANGHEPHTGVPSTGTFEPCPYE